MTTTIEPDVEAAINAYLHPRSHVDAEAAIRAALQPVTLSGPGFSLTIQIDRTRERQSYELEKASFRRMLDALHQTHPRKFVAIHDGAVAAYGDSMNTVIRQFFSAHPRGTSVYIGFVGDMPAMRVSAPLAPAES